MNKLIVVIMGQNCQKFIEMCLNSVKDADAIVYCDGGSTDGTLDVIDKFYEEKIMHSIEPKEIINIYQEYDQEDKQMNGKQRNFYLDYVKKNYPDYWCLVLDADEVVEDINKVKEFIQTADPGLYSVKMEHFIGDLGHLDNTTKEHFVPNRLFKISEAESYPEDSHPILTGGKQSGTRCTTIWHLGHLPVEYIHYIVKRGNEHLDNSTIHTKEFLKDWKLAHLFGTYPTRQFNVCEIPRVILDNFKINFDELYFHGRDKMEAKHYQDAIDWKKYFKLNGADNHVSVVGCGFGQRLHTMKQIGLQIRGVEISKHAIDNAVSDGLNIEHRSIVEKKPYGGGMSNLVVAYDVLEHISYEDLDKAIDNIIDISLNYILVSVPFKGTYNCDADPTHIIKEDREWWVKKFTDKGLTLIKTPEHFQYKEQILIFKKEEDK